MCLQALTSFVKEAIVYLDVAYARAVELTENDWMFVVETDFIANDLLASAKPEQQSDKTSSTHDVRIGALNRLVRNLRPSHQLQRNSSKSSNRSDCSERLHQQLRLQESLSSFPTFQETSFLPWRKKPTKGKHRSLQGKTHLKISPRQHNQQESISGKAAGSSSSE